MRKGAACSIPTREEIARAEGADLFEIVPAQPYTAADLDWTDKKSRTTLEMSDPACRPAVIGKVADMPSYDTVFLGFPIWWYVAPRIIETFLESYDFSGKTIVPFFTSGGSSAGKTDAVLRACCSENTHWLPSRRIANAGAAAAWAASLNL